MSISLILKPQLTRSMIALCTGACGTLAFSPYDIWPASLCALTGLLTIILNRTPLQATWLGFIWGIGLFSTGINWVYISLDAFSCMPRLTNVLLTVLLTAYLSIYPMLFAGLITLIWPSTSLWRLVFASPMLWMLTEHLRSWVLTGFPWLQFGYSQIDGPLKGIAPIMGVEAITFILVVFSGLAAFSLAERRWFPALVIPILLLLCWPLHFLKWYHVDAERAINVALVQGNIIQSMKLDISQIDRSLDLYLKKTIQYIGKAKIIIWPESAIPYNEIDHNQFITQLDQMLRKHGTSLITGIIDTNPVSDGLDYCYNSILVLGEELAPYHYHGRNRYTKHHLVPFGETLLLQQHQLQSWAPFFNIPMSSLSKGPYIQPQLTASGMKLTAAICYEIIFGRQIRDNFKPDSDFLITISNDAWFGRSIGPWQHFQMSRMRSLELGRPLLSSTNNGITAVINADGTLQAQLPQFIRSVLEVRVTPTSGITPYARVGSSPIWAISLQFGIIALLFGRKHQEKDLDKKI